VASILPETDDDDDVVDQVYCDLILSSISTEIREDNPVARKLQIFVSTLELLDEMVDEAVALTSKIPSVIRNNDTFWEDSPDCAPSLVKSL